MKMDSWPAIPRIHSVYAGAPCCWNMNLVGSILKERQFSDNIQKQNKLPFIKTSL